MPRYDAAATLFQMERYAEAADAYALARQTAGAALRTKIDYALGNTALALGDVTRGDRALRRVPGLADRGFRSRCRPPRRGRQSPLRRGVGPAEPGAAAVRGRVIHRASVSSAGLGRREPGCPGRTGARAGRWVPTGRGRGRRDAGGVAGPAGAGLHRPREARPRIGLIRHSNVSARPVSTGSPNRPRRPPPERTVRSGDG